MDANLWVKFMCIAWIESERARGHAMGNGNGRARTVIVGLPSLASSAHDASAGTSLHPAWRAFIQFCDELRHGQIEDLKIQDGLPLLAEVTKKKVKFT